MLDLPRQSQHAVLTQRIGIADITINYHRPLVNDRKVWGGIIPYGHRVFDGKAVESLRMIFATVCTDFETTLVEIGRDGRRRQPRPSAYPVPA